jgi:hypothetical protein
VDALLPKIINYYESKLAQRDRELLAGEPTQQEFANRLTSVKYLFGGII